MIEVEVKIPLRDYVNIIKQLEILGFKKEMLYEEEDKYYTSTFYNMLEKKEALRIRKQKNLQTGESTAKLTYKGPKLDEISMSRKELETIVGSAEVVDEILGILGFQTIYTVRKTRQYMENKTMICCVDYIEKLGWFLEIEIMVEKEEEKAQGLEKIEKLLKQLGYSLQDTTQTSYLRMLMKEYI